MIFWKFHIQVTIGLKKVMIYASNDLKKANKNISLTNEAIFGIFFGKIGKFESSEIFPYF